MTDLQLWAVLVGAFMPLVIAAIQQPKFSEPTRNIITFLVCLIAGGGTAYFQGDLTGRRFISAALFVLVTAVLTYRTWWKPTGAAPAIERVTTIGPTALIMVVVLLTLLLL